MSGGGKNSQLLFPASFFGSGDGEPRSGAYGEQSRRGRSNSRRSKDAPDPLDEHVRQSLARGAQGWMYTIDLLHRRRMQQKGYRDDELDLLAERREPPAPTVNKSHSHEAGSMRLDPDTDHPWGTPMDLADRVAVTVARAQATKNNPAVGLKSRYAKSAPLLPAYNPLGHTMTATPSQLLLPSALTRTQHSQRPTSKLAIGWRGNKQTSPRSVSSAGSGPVGLAGNNQTSSAERSRHARSASSATRALRKTAGADDPKQQSQPTRTTKRTPSIIVAGGRSIAVRGKPKAPEPLVDTASSQSSGLPAPPIQEADGNAPTIGVVAMLAATAAAVHRGSQWNAQSKFHKKQRKAQAAAIAASIQQREDEERKGMMVPKRVPTPSRRQEGRGSVPLLNNSASSPAVQSFLSGPNNNDMNYAAKLGFSIAEFRMLQRCFHKICHTYSGPRPNRFALGGTNAGLLLRRSGFAELIQKERRGRSQAQRATEWGEEDHGSVEAEVVPDVFIDRIWDVLLHHTRRERSTVKHQDVRVNSESGSMAVNLAAYLRMAHLMLLASVQEQVAFCYDCLDMDRDGIVSEDDLLEVWQMGADSVIPADFHALSKAFRHKLSKHPNKMYQRSSVAVTLHDWTKHMPRNREGQLPVPHLMKRLKYCMHDWWYEMYSNPKDRKAGRAGRLGKARSSGLKGMDADDSDEDRDEDDKEQDPLDISEPGGKEQTIVSFNITALDDLAKETCFTMSQVRHLAHHYRAVMGGAGVWDVKMSTRDFATILAPCLYPNPTLWHSVNDAFNYATPHNSTPSSAAAMRPQSGASSSQRGGSAHSSQQRSVGSRLTSGKSKGKPEMGRNSSSRNVLSDDDDEAEERVGRWGEEDSSDEDDEVAEQDMEEQEREQEIQEALRDTADTDTRRGTIHSQDRSHSAHSAEQRAAKRASVSLNPPEAVPVTTGYGGAAYGWRMSLEELTAMRKQLALKLFFAFDEDRCESIDFREFVLTLSHYVSGTSDDRLNFWFRALSHAHSLNALTLPRAMELMQSSLFRSLSRSRWEPFMNGYLHKMIQGQKPMLTYTEWLQCMVVVCSPRSVGLQGEEATAVAAAAADKVDKMMRNAMRRAELQAASSPSQHLNTGSIVNSPRTSPSGRFSVGRTRGSRKPSLENSPAKRGSVISAASVAAGVAPPPADMGDASDSTSGAAKDKTAVGKWLTELEHRLRVAFNPLALFAIPVGQFPLTPQHLADISSGAVAVNRTTGNTLAPQPASRRASRVLAGSGSPKSALSSPMTSPRSSMGRHSTVSSVGSLYRAESSGTAAALDQSAEHSSVAQQPENPTPISSLSKLKAAVASPHLHNNAEYAREVADKQERRLHEQLLEQRMQQRQRFSHMRHLTGTMPHDQRFPLEEAEMYGTDVRSRDDSVAKGYGMMRRRAALQKNLHVDEHTQSAPTLPR